MNVAQETLDFRCADFPSALSLLMPTSAILCASACITAHLRPETHVDRGRTENAPLPLRLAAKPVASVRGLSPENYRRWVA